MLGVFLRSNLDHRFLVEALSGWSRLDPGPISNLASKPAGVAMTPATRSRSCRGRVVMRRPKHSMRMTEPRATLRKQLPKKGF